MIKGLSTKNKFKTDLERYQNKILQIEDSKIKKVGEKLLKEFCDQAKLIDETHTTIGNGYIDPRSVRASVEKLITVRLNLERFIKDL